METMLSILSLQISPAPHHLQADPHATVRQSRAEADLDNRTPAIIVLPVSCPVVPPWTEPVEG